jgi:hypothetical protein
MTSCNVPSEELELASAAVELVLTAIAVVVVGAVVDKVGIDN